MTTLSQITEGTDIARQVIRAAEPFGFNAIMVVVMFGTIVFGLTVHFLKVVIPERDSRIKSIEKLTECTEQNTQHLGMIVNAFHGLPCRGPQQPPAVIPSSRPFGA